MIQIAYIIRCNDNPMAVVLNKQSLAESEKIALITRDLASNKSQYNNDLGDYLLARRWDILTIKVTDKVTTPFDPAPEARSHVPETFPQPEQQRLPGQTQLKRVQLPASKVVEFYCPICESTTKGVHRPGCPEAVGVVSGPPMPGLDLKGEGKG